MRVGWGRFEAAGLPGWRGLVLPVLQTAHQARPERLGGTVETHMVPEKYDKFETPGLSVTVEAESLNRLSVELVD